MKLALFQGPSLAGDDEAAFAKIGQVLAVAARAGAAMAVFPELYLPGYNQPDLIRARAQPRGGSWETAFSQLAAAAGCGLVVGWAEADGNRIFNTASAFGKDGVVLARHRKLQPFGAAERAIFAAGDSYTLFEFGSYRAALLICYDIEFPEHVRAVATQGAQLIFVSTANGIDYVGVPELLVPARALENRALIVYANYCGDDNGLRYSGRSTIVGPDGVPLATAGLTEAILICDVPAAREIRREGLSTQHADLRPVLSPSPAGVPLRSAAGAEL